MTFKIIGSSMIIMACGAYGFTLASKYTHEHKMLHILLDILQTMECELQYRMTPLPDLCELISRSFEGGLSQVFRALANELNAQISPNVELCMNKVLNNISLPKQTKCALESLGRSLGKYDIDGQMKGIHTLYGEVQQAYKTLMTNRDQRLRSYRTLGLCIGIVIAIILL